MLLRNNTLSRRLLGLAAVAGLASAAVFASPASAATGNDDHGAKLVFKTQSCNTDIGEATLTWTLSPNTDKTLYWVLDHAAPVGTDPTQGQLTGNSSAEVTMVVPFDQRDFQHDDKAFVKITLSDTAFPTEEAASLKAGDSDNNRSRHQEVSDYQDIRCFPQPRLVVKGTFTCDTAGVATIAWSVTNPTSFLEPIKATAITPDGGALTIEGAPTTFDGLHGTILVGATLPVGQQIPVPFSSGTATITWEFSFEHEEAVAARTDPLAAAPDSIKKAPKTVTGSLDYSCAPPPTPTAVGLPVTGSSTMTFAGIAAVLVVGGAGLVFMARRRRVRSDG